MRMLRVFGGPTQKNSYRQDTYEYEEKFGRCKNTVALYFDDFTTINTVVNANRFGLTQLEGAWEKKQWKIV